MEFSSKEEAAVYYLKSIANHVEPKPSYYMTVSGKSSLIHTNFNPPLVFPSGCHYEIACCGVETYYSFPNIDDDDNKVQVSFDEGKSWMQLEVPKGCYNITSINIVLRRLIKDKKSDKKDYFCLKPDHASLQCIITLKKIWLDFRGDKGSLRTVHGFDQKIYKDDEGGRHVSEHIVNILRVNTVLVHCDVVKLSRRNGIPSPIIYNFFPNVAPGYKIVDKPKNLIYLPLTLNIISQMTCWLTDQDDNALDLRGEELSLTFHIKAC